MSSIADRLKALVSSWWGRVFPFPPPTPLPVPVAVGTPKAPATVPSPGDDEGKHYETGPETSGIFHLKEGLLDRLEEAFTYARRVKKADREAYDLHLRMGATLLPNHMQMLAQELNEWWRAGNRPSFGCVAFLGENTKEEVSVKFAYFSKIENPGRDVIAPEGSGTIYSIRAYYDDIKDWKKYKRGDVAFCHVEVTGDGRILLCKEKYFDTVKIRHKKRAKTAGRHSRIYVPKMGVPSHFAAIAKYRKEAPEDLARRLMSITADAHWRTSSGMIQVRVKKGTHAMCFSVAHDKVAQFFADRDVADGQKKRIFHVVRAHTRSGTAVRKGSNVRMHFRGLRAFDWKGYRVVISVPGLHHGSLLQLDEGATIMAGDGPTPRGWVGVRRVGKTVGDVLDREKGRTLREVRA